VVDRFAGSSPRAVRDGGARQTCAPRAADTAARSPRITHARGIALSNRIPMSPTAGGDCVRIHNSLASQLVRLAFCSCNDHANVFTRRHASLGLAARRAASLAQHDDRSTSTRLTHAPFCACQQVVQRPARLGRGQLGVQHRLSASRHSSTSSIRGRIETRACLVGRAPFLPAEVIAALPASRRVAQFHTLARGWISPQG